MPTAVRDFARTRTSAHRRAISPTTPPETLQGLLDLINTWDNPRNIQTTMLRTTAGYICRLLDKPPTLVKLGELTAARPALGPFLRNRGLKRNSARSYVNFLRILIQRAVDFGWSLYPSDVTTAWRQVRQAVCKVRGCDGIVGYCIRKGKLPTDVTETDIKEWEGWMLQNGRQYHYVKSLQRSFKRCVLEAGLGLHFPGLIRSEPLRSYGVPLDQFPEPLRTQMTGLIKWKSAKFSPDRPNRARHRPITARNLQSFLCRLVGYHFRIKGELISNLGELFSKDRVCDYVTWAINERNVTGNSLAVGLGMMYALRQYPLLGGRDLEWIQQLISQLPTNCQVTRRESDEAKWVPYDVLAALPGRIRRDAERAHLSGKLRAIMARNELLLAWLTILPWRQRNLRDCRVLLSSLGGNIFKEALPLHYQIARSKWVDDAFKVNPNETFWQFWFRPDETKNGFAVRGILPKQLVHRLEEYLQCYRPILIDGPDPSNLFLNDHGRPFLISHLCSVIENITFRYTGKRVNPHLFRKIFAVKWLEEHPEDFLTLSKILWHRNIQTTIRTYGKGYDESHGARRIEEWLDKREADSLQGVMA